MPETTRSLVSGGLKIPFARLLSAAGVAVLTLTGGSVRAADEITVRELQKQNALLLEQLKAQQAQIEELRSQVQIIADSQREASAVARGKEPQPTARSAASRLSISGVGSLTFLSGQNQGRYPNAEFMLDEARLFAEAQILRNAYAHAELVLVNREALDENFHLGEFYVEFEDALGSIAPERLFNFRAGRLFIPFGEEYQRRNPIDNPLITHSVTDFWGVDEGIELFGEYGKFNYAVALQNGDISRLRDRTADKSLTLRLGWQPSEALQVSVSAYDSGRLDPKQDLGSEMWVGNNVFRSFADSALATFFQVQMGQVDLRYRWSGGTVAGAYGRGRVSDNDPIAQNDQSFTFYQLEGEQTLGGKWYGAARYSHLGFDRGYYLSGLGSLGTYFLGSSRTRSMDRFTVGAGYRFSADLNLKIEYTWETNKWASGAIRPEEDQLAAQVAVRF